MLLAAFFTVLARGSKRMNNARTDDIFLMQRVSKARRFALNDATLNFDLRTALEIEKTSSGFYSTKVSTRMVEIGTGSN